MISYSLFPKYLPLPFSVYLKLNSDPSHSSVGPSTPVPSSVLSRSVMTSPSIQFPSRNVRTIPDSFHSPASPEQWPGQTHFSPYVLYFLHLNHSPCFIIKSFIYSATCKSLYPSSLRMWFECLAIASKPSCWRASAAGCSLILLILPLSHCGVFARQGSICSPLLQLVVAYV